MKIIDIAKRFSKYPGGRYYEDGDYSGQRFRDEVFIPLLDSDESPILFVMDGTRGYDSSFLEEAFGGVFRHSDYNYEYLINRVSFRSEDEFLLEEIAEYMVNAWQRKNRS